VLNKTIIALALNHYEGAESFNYAGLMGFLKSASQAVLERNPSEKEMDELFAAVVNALFNN
jgi:hypothetical protein